MGTVSEVVLKLVEGSANYGSCVTHLSVLQSTIPRTKRFIAALQLRTHATVRLTAFELQLPTDPTTRTIPGKSLDDTFNSSEATVTKPEEAHTRSRTPSPNRSMGHRRSASQSPGRSTYSERPLVQLQLTPSAEQYFRTEIVAQADSKQENTRCFKKHDGNDWKKYLSRRSKAEEDINLSTMFSWKSRNSIAQERIVQTKEVTQRVEVVQPKESRWTFGKQGDSSKRNSKGQSVGSKRQSFGQADGT